MAVTPLEEWMKYLKDGTIRPDTTAPGLGEAIEKLRYYSMPPKERLAYDPIEMNPESSPHRKAEDFLTGTLGFL